VADSYSWSDLRDEGPSHLPGPDHLGWWVVVSLLLAVVLHVIGFFALGRIKVALGFDDAEILRTRHIQLDPVEALPPQMDELAPTPEAVDVADTASLLEEIDVLARLPEDHELDITPEATDPEFAIQPQAPALDGLPSAIELDPASDFNLDTELTSMGSTSAPLPPAAEGQIVVDPGEVSADDPALDAFTEEILRHGVENGSPAGTLDGVVSLDDLVGLPEDVLVGKKTMLPSDLLFEYNSAELRESARVGLMKLALLIERNPGLYCWIEGHTDLFGGDAFNLDLSQRRARSVKSYLTASLGLPGGKIATRGYGKTAPIVLAGDVARQAPNRRVEIKMRRTLPTDKPITASRTPPPEPAPAPPKAVPVKPLPQLEVPPAVEEPAPPRRAVPVAEPEPRRAVPVEEPAPPRAVPVE
jgi:outer membrane protein OmpA-like peptidoglycan-associated protein